MGEDEIWFIRASLDQVVYGCNEMEIIFNYSPERYEIGKIMILKGVVVKMDYDDNRMYSISDLLIFFKNKFNGYNIELNTDNVSNMVDALLTFKKTICLDDKSNWESEFVSYNQAKFKNYNPASADL